MRKSHTVREVITYPKVTVTTTYDPCHDEYSPYEHVLACRHLITTPEPYEPCAPNCYHANGTRSRQAPKMTLSAALKKEFYCDACVELEGENEIPATATNEEAGEQVKSNAAITTDKFVAEDQRAEYRQTTTAIRNKALDFRTCYIAQKTISVPCDDEGEAVEGYRSHPPHNAYDMSWPPTGANMYEDVETIRPQKSKEKKRRRSAAVRVEPDEPAIHIKGAVAEDVNETVTEGARWLREEEDRERRRAEEGTPATRRRRAAARPIVISSSPDIGISSFVVDESSLLTAQTNAQDDSPTPVIAKKKRDRKRKEATNDETTSIPAAKPKKPVIATPKAPSPSPRTLIPAVDVPTARTTATGRGSDVPYGAAKAALERHRKRAAENEAATGPAVRPTKRTKATPQAPNPAHDYRGPQATTGQKRKNATSSGSPAKSAKKMSKRVCTVL